MNKAKSDFIFGFHPVLEAIDAGEEIEKVIFKKGLQGEFYRKVFEKVNSKKIPFQFVPLEKLNKITRKNHQGVVAYISMVENQSVENLVPMIFEKGEIPFILVLDRITDVRNFGGIVRTAECAGVHAIVVPIKNAAKINADAAKTSAGALFNMNICRVENLKKTIEFLKNSGLQIIAANEKSSKHIYHADFKTPSVLVMGAEDSGVSPEILNLADVEVDIPMKGKIGSLNVSNAAAVLMFEVVRQRLT